MIFNRQLLRVHKHLLHRCLVFGNRKYLKHHLIHAIAQGLNQYPILRITAYDKCSKHCLIFM